MLANLRDDTRLETVIRLFEPPPPYSNHMNVGVDLFTFYHVLVPHFYSHQFMNFHTSPNYKSSHASLVWLALSCGEVKLFRAPNTFMCHLYYICLLSNFSGCKISVGAKFIDMNEGCFDNNALEIRRLREHL